MFIVILGRESKISLIELEALFGAAKVRPLASNIALVQTDDFNLSRLGGSIKAGKIISGNLLDHLLNLPDGKITLGVSDYSLNATEKSSSAKALKLKSILKRHGRSVRVISNNSSAWLSSATAHHNQLGEKAKHIEVILYDKYTAISIGAQNITAYAQRDQARPARDSFVGMLPPKLAQILINLATNNVSQGRILDPFCGTGTILQESLLMGYSVYGTDLSEKMIRYSQKNLSWIIDLPRFRQQISENSQTLTLKNSNSVNVTTLELGDATKHSWNQPIDFVASEVYLGQPFSAPPSEIKLKEVKYTTKSILLAFLKNLAPQIKSNTPIALAIPAWRRPSGEFSSLNILDEIAKLGYNVHKFKHATSSDLLYYRETQFVARQIIVLRKI